MRLRFSGEIWYWRGPSPFYFVTVPEEQCRDLREVSAARVVSAMFTGETNDQPAGTVGSVTVHSRPVGMFPVTFVQPLPSVRATSWS